MGVFGDCLFFLSICIMIEENRKRRYCVMNGQNRANIKIGAQVKIVLKKDQPTGKLTEGVVARILTKSPNHPHGIKVMLEDGQVGRVQEIGSSQNG